MSRKTIRDIQKLKDDGQRIAMLTAYDATSARLAELAEVPMLLVGDTLGMVIQGHDSTIPVTLEQMIYHAGIVCRVTKIPLIVGDLPFMTYSVSPEQALTHSARLMQEAGVSAVKLEGGEALAPTIARIVHAGIPVMAHIGLTPQSVNAFGGFRVQGRELDSARQLLRDADAVQAAGAFAVVLELVPTPLAKLITQRLHIPTIGIGAGEATDGQVQVFHDILGLFTDFIPRHTKRYLEGSTVLSEAIRRYRQEVEAGLFPTEDHSFGMKADIMEQLQREFTPHVRD
ncbi:MAG: 3-methyl-2-oxobutanoate hydroxymethyltransferase [Phototrophicaceae bacterium]|jgi:3-methyl-2-oxobutanoate hydroxymethyltransferase